MLPILMALVAAAGFATSGILARLAGQRIPVLLATAVSVLGSLALAAIPALMLELPSLARISIAGFLWIILLAFVNYPLGRACNFMSISRIGAARASPLFASSPFWSTLLAVIFLGERSHGVVVVGTAAIVAGIILIVTDRRVNELNRSSRRPEAT